MSETVAIVGSRDFRNLRAVTDYVNALPLDAKVISGGAKGVDAWAAMVARHRGMAVEEIYADWDAHGKSAGYKRNVLLVEKADRVVAFWSGTSKGTKHTIDIARNAGKLCEVIMDEGK